MLLTPIEPAPTGNGLAMRCELFRRAAARDREVVPLVVPVAGRLPDGVPRAPGAVSVGLDAAAARSGVAALLADPAWRDRLARAGSLPSPARAASPGLAGLAVDALPADGPVDLHVMRAYLAPLGAAVAHRLRPARLTLDLDEDDAACASARGDPPEEAEAYVRLLTVFAPLFDALSVASAPEADAIGARHDVRVRLIPNAVEVPARPPARPGPTPEPTLLLVGNLTYEPNVEAARTLARTIAPSVARRLGRRVRVTLVGPHDGRVEPLAGADVEVTGFVADLGAAYAAADVVVVPLEGGGGTRIKLLEAFAHGVPVVASPAAAAGLDVEHGRHLLLASDAEQSVAAVAAVLDDRDLGLRLASEAFGLVRARYGAEAVIPLIRALLQGDGGEPQSARPG